MSARWLRQLALPILLVGGASSCHTVHQQPVGGAAPGLFYSDVGYPNERASAVNHRLRIEDLQIGDPVLSEETSVDVSIWTGGLGQQDILGIDESSYGAVVHKLLKTNDYDGLLNKYISTRVYSLNLLLFRVTRVTTQVGGVGYRILDAEAGASP